MANNWRYVKQINNFFRIEEPREGNTADGSPLGPRVICFMQHEVDAKFVCHVVNASDKTVEMFMDKPKSRPEKAEVKGAV